MSERTVRVVSAVCMAGSAVFLGAALWVVVFGAPAGSDGLVRGALAAYAGLTGVALGAVCGFFGGRRSARGELESAHEAWAAQNAAPERDALALPPERTGDLPVVDIPSWQHSGEPAITERCESCGGVGNVRLADESVLCRGCEGLLVGHQPMELHEWQATQDDTGPGTVAHLRESGVYGRWMS